MAAFRLFRPSPTKDSSRPSSRSSFGAEDAGSRPFSGSPQRQIKKSGSSPQMLNGEFTTSPTAISYRGKQGTGDSVASGVPSINVTNSSPLTADESLGEERERAELDLRSFGQRRSGKASKRGSDAGAAPLAVSSKRASRQGLSEADVHGGPMSAVDFGSVERGHGRYATMGPSTAGMDRHSRMRRAQAMGVGTGLGSSESEGDEDEDESMETEEDHEDGGYDDVADGRRLTANAPLAASSPSLTGGQHAVEAAQHDVVQAQTSPASAHGLVVQPSTQQAGAPGSPAASMQSAFDAVPGEGSLTLDSLLGEVVGVDGSVRPPGAGSSVGHGSASGPPSRRPSHNGHTSRTDLAGTGGGGAGVGQFGERVRGPAGPAARKSLAGAEGGAQGGRSASGAQHVPPALALSASAARPAEALLSPAQVAPVGITSRARNANTSKMDRSPGTSSAAGAATQSKTGSAGSGGIAGALAAGGLAAANFGVAGIAAAASSPPPAGTSRHSSFLRSSSGSSSHPSRTASPAAVAALTPGAGAHAENGFQGGIYRNPDTGEMVEVGEGQQDLRTPVFDSMSRESSGLGAAAHFQPELAPLLSPLPPEASAATVRTEANNFAGSLGMEMADAMVDDPEVALRQTLSSSGGSSYQAARGAGAGEGGSSQGQAWDSNAGLETQITGFAVASSKRNADFHAIFGSVAEDDYLIEDYGCALQREILIQGRLYISENHLCFNSNIFGWVTNVVVPFSEIVAIEKRMTAFVIPNAIQTATLHTKHTFSSFLSRDATYDLIANIWKLSHPSLPQNQALQDLDLSEEDEPQGLEPDGDGSKARMSKRAKLRRRFMASRHANSHGEGEDEEAGKDGEGEKEDEAAAPSAVAGSGSGGAAQKAKKAAHKPTTCACDKDKKHYSTVVLDSVYPAKPEKMYNLLFTSGFMKDFWTGSQKLTELQMSDWSPSAEHDGLLSRSLTYIKPLGGSFGPKQAKCVITDENLHVDFDDYVTTLTTTKTPEVPSGGSFAVKTRTCFTWAGGNTTKLYVTCGVEWTGRSMIKGMIEKASIDGQKQYYKDLDAAIRQNIKEHPSEFKEEGDDEAAIEEAADATAPTEAQNATNEAQETNKETTDSSASPTSAGGVLELVQDFVGGAFDMVQDLLKDAHPSMLILSGIVVILLISNIWTWSSASSRREAQNQHRMRLERSSPANYGGSQDPDAISRAIRDVFKDILPQPGVAIAPSDELKNLVGLLDQVEQRLGKLKSAVAAAEATGSAKQDL